MDRLPESVGAGFALNTDERDLIRSLVVADPSLVLDDMQVMRALIGETAPEGRRVVDLRDRLVERLEGRLERLVSANRSMIAAAYENVSGTRQLHAAVVALVGAETLGALLHRLTHDVPGMLGVADARLCLEAEVGAIAPAVGLGTGGRVLAVPEGMVAEYLTLDLGGAPERVVLREASAEAELLFGATTPVRSEALVRLDILGAAGLMAFGSEELERFAPDQGTDLLEFFGDVLERLLAQRLEADGPGR